VLFPHGGGISFFKCLFIRRSARGLSSEEDDVHKLTSAVLACLSTYVSYDEKSDKKWLIFSPNKNCMDTLALKRKERAKGIAEVMQVKLIKGNRDFSVNSLDQKEDGLFLQSWLFLHKLL